jgi:phenylalanyl-tRNA synthetase beta subunit
LHSELKPLDIYEKGDAKHFTFRLTAAHHQKTLKATEINELLDKLAERAKQKFKAERI